MIPFAMAAVFFFGADESTPLRKKETSVAVTAPEPRNPGSTETRAANKLALVKKLSDPVRRRRFLVGVIKIAPDSEAAEEAKALLQEGPDIIFR